MQKFQGFVKVLNFFVLFLFYINCEVDENEFSLLDVNIKYSSGIKTTNFSLALKLSDELSISNVWLGIGFNTLMEMVIFNMVSTKI